MKIVKCLAVGICPMFFTFAGCYLPRPVLQTPYVDTGNILQWPATGKPFQIYWLENDSWLDNSGQPSLGPCLKSDTLKSDGKNDVICHAFKPGSFDYFIDKPDSPRHRKPRKRTGVFIMHVGSCSGCSKGLLDDNGNGIAQPQMSGSSTSTPANGEVDISCGAKDDPTKVNPPTGPSGLKVGDDVVFYFKGNYIPDTTPMTLTFLPGNCANSPDSTQPFVISGSSGYCEVNTTPTITYSATANTCKESQGTLSVSSSQ